MGAIWGLSFDARSLASPSNFNTLALASTFIQGEGRVSRGRNIGNSLSDQQGKAKKRALI